MKVCHGQKSRQHRRRTSRPCPYDLRRRVLVNNFLRDSKTPPRCPSPVLGGSSSQTLKRTISVVEEEDEEENDFSTDSDIPLDGCVTTDLTSSDSDIPNTVVYALESLRTDDVKTEEFESNKISEEELNQFSPETTEFLYLMSRRLRISENQKLRQPCRRSLRCYSKARRSRSPRLHTANQEQYSSSSSSVESDQNYDKKNQTKELFPLRSYPTFDRLNEVFECNETTMKRTAIFLRKRMNSLANRSMAKVSFPTKSPQRSNLLRQSLRSMFKQRKPNSLELASYRINNGTSSASSDNQESSESSTNQNLGKKLKRRNSVISRLMNSVRKNSSKVIIEAESRPRTRSMRSKSFAYRSFSQLPKLRHRAASFILNKNFSYNS